MEMNNDIFTPDLPIPEPVGFEDSAIPAPAEDRKFIDENHIEILKIAAIERDINPRRDKYC